MIWCRCQVLCGIPAVMTKRSSRSLWGSQLDPKISEPWDLYAMNFRTMGPEWSFLIRGRNLRVSGRKQISPWLEMGKSYIINNYTLERIRGRIWTWHFLGCWRLAKTIWPTWRLQTGKKQSNHEWARNQRTQNLKGLLCLCWWNTAMGATQPRNSQRWKPLGLSTCTCPDWLRESPHPFHLQNVVIFHPLAWLLSRPWLGF